MQKIFKIQIKVWFLMILKKKNQYNKFKIETYYFWMAKFKDHQEVL